MPWVAAGSTITPSIGVSSVAARSASITITEPIAGAISYRYTYTDRLGATIVVDTTSTSIVATNLAADGDTTISVVVTVVANGTTEFQTLQPPTLWTHRLDILQAYFSNGMLNGVGQVPIEGATPENGRTYNGQLIQLERDTRNPLNLNIYGVRFLLANLRQNAISGGKLLFGLAPGTANGDLIPAGGNVMHASDPLQGWVRATVNGNPNLPVPAATSQRMGAAWTDWLRFDARPYKAGKSVWRFFHPGQNAATDYALSFAYWGDTAVSRGGTVAGSAYFTAMHYVDMYDLSIDYAYADGDGVTDPTTIPYSVFQNHRSPNGGLKDYGPPGPGSFPFIAAQYLVENIL